LMCGDEVMDLVDAVDLVDGQSCTEKNKTFPH
jgi:hypothetical protein